MGGGGGGWVLITVDDGGGGGKNCQNIDYVICERPLIGLQPTLTGDTRKIFVSRPSTSLTRRAS